MADEAGEHELAHAVEKIGRDNEGNKGKESDSENNAIVEQVRKQHTEEDSIEQTPNVNTNIENELNVRNSNLIVEGRGTDDTAVQTSEKSNPDEIMSEDIEEPSDSFFDGFLTDEFLDSLAVVDAWDPDADGSCESDAETKREEDGNNRQLASENKIKDRDKTISKDSENKSKSDKSCHRRSGDHSSRSDSRRRDKASRETKHRSKERTAHRKDKGDTGEHTHSLDKDIQKGYKKTRDRSRERRKERNTSRIVKCSRDHMERSIHRRDRNSKDRSTERNVNKREKDKHIERSVQNDDKNKNIVRTSHRYSYQYRISNKERTADNNAKERNSDLRHCVSDACAGGESGAVQKRQQSPKEVNRREEGSSESHRNGKSFDLNMANKESQRDSIKNYHLEKGTSDMVKHVSENRMTEAVAGNQQYVITKRDNPPLNDTKLDTCIKELADLVPPGTENDFILPTRDEPVKVADDIKKKYITNVKEKPECKTVNNELLSEETKNPNVLDSEKSCKNPMVKSESQDKEICAIGEKNDEDKILEGNESEKASLCTTGQQPHGEVKGVNASHERKRRRSGSNRSEQRRSSASRKRRRRRQRRKKLLRSSSEEKKRHSSSLERMFEASRMKNEQFNELLRKKRLLESDRGENCPRSQSRERWLYHNDLHRLMGKYDQNDTRRSRSGSRGNQRELSEGQERMGRSRSRDRQFRRASSAERWQPSIDTQRPNRKMDVQNNSRRSVRSLSREKQRESSLPIRISRSRSRDREHRNEYRDRRERSRKSLSIDVENSRRSPSWDRNKRRALELSPVSVGRMSLSPSISFELSPISSEREPKRRFSRSRSRERRSHEYRRSHRDSFSPLSSGSTFSRSDSFVSLSSMSDDSHYRRKRRKRSPFWKELERQFAKDLSRSFYNQSAGYSSAAGTAHPEGCSSSSYPSQSTFPPSAVPYPPNPAVYSHNYPSEPGFSGAVIQPPLPQNHAGPPTFVSAPPLHLEPAPVPPVMTPTSVPLPVPPPIYNVPPPIPMGYPGQLAPFLSISEFPSTENMSNQPLHCTEEVQDSPQVPPPPKISQLEDENKMSLSSLLEASVKDSAIWRTVPPSSGPAGSANPVPRRTSVVCYRCKKPGHIRRECHDRLSVAAPPSSQPCNSTSCLTRELLTASQVGGSSKRKAMSVDPVLVARCEEAIHTLEANDQVILVSPGHLVLQESSMPYSSTTAVMQASLEDANMFQSPILRTPDPQLSFTTPPVRDEEMSEPLNYLPNRDITVSVEGEPNTCGAPLGPHAVTSLHAVGSTETLELYVDASTMTDFCDDGKKVSKRPQKCFSCVERTNRIMVWNSTQTPPSLDIGDKIMVWNSTQTPHMKVENVGVQVQIVKLGRLRKWVARKKRSHKQHAVKEGNDVKSGVSTVNKHSSSYSNASKTPGSFSDMTPTAALKEDRNKEAASEANRQSPKQSGLSASSENEGGHNSKDSFYKLSPYQTYEHNHGQSSFSLYSSGRSDKESAVSSPVSQRTVAPKGILKTRSNLELQPPPVLPAPSSQMPWQQSSSLRNCDFPEYSVPSPVQTSMPCHSSGSLREFGRSSSSSLGGMGTSSSMQLTSSNTGSMFGTTAASFPRFGNPDIGSTPNRDQNFYGLHHNQFSSLLQGNGNPGAGLGMQPFQHHQSSMIFQQTGNPSMMPHDAGTRY